MKWDRIEGAWSELKGRLRVQWAKLTDDDLLHIGGKKERLVGKLQERYGTAKDRAERDIDDWLAAVGEDEQPDTRH